MSAHRHDYHTVFHAEYGGIVRVAQLITGDVESGREVAQEAFAELFVHWSKVGDYDRPGAWVRRVAIRRAVKVRRRASRHPPTDNADLARRPARRHRHDGPSLDVQRALAALTPMQRAMVVLHYFDDLPVRDAAQVVGCRPATASVHLHRARARLGELLGEAPDPMPDKEVADDATR